MKNILKLHTAEKFSVFKYNSAARHGFEFDMPSVDHKQYFAPNL
jgi:hypothetical protein